MSIEYDLVLTFFFDLIRYSIFDSFHPGFVISFSKFKIIIGMPLPYFIYFADKFLCAKNPNYRNKKKELQ